MICPDIMSDHNEDFAGHGPMADCYEFGSLYISGKLPTFPSPKTTFCPKWEVTVDVGLGEG